MSHCVYDSRKGSWALFIPKLDLQTRSGHNFMYNADHGNGVPWHFSTFSLVYSELLKDPRAVRM